MGFPDFYDAARVGSRYTPNTASVIEAGRKAGLSPASDDKRRVILLLVDEQVDFVHTDGSLSVPGAVDDTRRTIEWLLNNIGQVTTIAASLDSHIPIQIFFPTWWADGDGNHPDPFTPITSAEVAAGRWKPLYEPEWSAEYVSRLEEFARKELMIWPYHVLIGTPGHNLTPALYEAIAFHTAARSAQPEILTKGMIPKTEHYSIMEPEIEVPDAPLGTVNTDFLDMLNSHDLIYVAGQARSHCVLETVSFMMKHFSPDSIAKVRVLTDCALSVAHPEIDFDAMADEAYGRFEENGLTLVKSTDDIG